MDASDAPQYVHADVNSHVPGAWMFYYTHHSYMDAPQNEDKDVLLDYFYY